MPWPETVITGLAEVHGLRLATIVVQDRTTIGMEHRLPLEATEAIMAVMQPEAIIEVLEHGLQEAIRQAEVTTDLLVAPVHEAIVVVDTPEVVGPVEATEVPVEAPEVLE
jgi:hypothetical protein